MSQTMQFDEEFTRKLIKIYSTPDVITQRDAVLAHARIQPGERTLDIGPGPGLTTQVIGEAVGETGSVVGIDVSDNALEIARKHCADMPWITFENADATRLPFDDASFDVAISTQVYEYVTDIDSALAELHRVLRPGGRAVILDSDWDSCVWHTHDRERMHRIIDLWNTHCPRPFLPRTLKQKLKQTGFEISARDTHTIFNPDYDPNTYSYGTMDFIVAYIKNSQGEPHDEVEAWEAELHELGQRGEYFFSLNRYIFVVTKS